MEKTCKSYQMDVAWPVFGNNSYLNIPKLQFYRFFKILLSKCNTTIVKPDMIQNDQYIITLSVDQNM